MSTLIWIWLIAGPPLGYALSCWIWPYAYCWCCNGSGKHARDDGRVFRACRWCSGGGRRLRLGRRAWNRARRGQ